MAVDLSKCIAEIRCFDGAVEEATSEAVTKIISKAELSEVGSLINEICAYRIAAAIQERDDMWRRHETAQISFLQNENSQMLTGLHVEIERLHHRLRDLYRRLYVKNSNMTLESENKLLRKRLHVERLNTDRLSEELEKCKKKSRELEQQTNETVKKLQNQLAYQDKRIRQLTDKLRERSPQITKLMIQPPSGTVVEKTENKIVDPVYWNPAPAPFFGRKSNNLLHAGLTRSASVTYPGGRPNVVAQRYSNASSTPRLHHLPSLYSKRPHSAPSSLAQSIEQPTALKTLALRDRMMLTRSLYEIRNSFITHSTNCETSISTDSSMQSTA